MSSTKNTANNSVSSVNIIMVKNLIFFVIEFQLDNNEINITMVVNKMKNMDIPSTPRLKFK